MIPVDDCREVSVCQDLPLRCLLRQSVASQERILCPPPLFPPACIRRSRFVLAAVPMSPCPMRASGSLPDSRYRCSGGSSRIQGKCGQCIRQFRWTVGDACGKRGLLGAFRLALQPGMFQTRFKRGSSDTNDNASCRSSHENACW